MRNTIKTKKSEISNFRNSKILSQNLSILNFDKEQLTRLPDSRKHSLVFDWLTKVTDFLRRSDSVQIRAAQVYELESHFDFLFYFLGWSYPRVRNFIGLQCRAAGSSNHVQGNGSAIFTGKSLWCLSNNQ